MKKLLLCFVIGLFSILLYLSTNPEVSERGGAADELPAQMERHTSHQASPSSAMEQPATDTQSGLQQLQDANQNYDLVEENDRILLQLPSGEMISPEELQIRLEEVRERLATNLIELSQEDIAEERAALQKRTEAFRSQPEKVVVAEIEEIDDTGLTWQRVEYEDGTYAYFMKSDERSHVEN